MDETANKEAPHYSRVLLKLSGEALMGSHGFGIDPEIVNTRGGAIAIGHPLAASGTRITIHLLHALRREKKRFGLGSACIGGGQGAAVIVEAL